MVRSIGVSNFNTQQVLSLFEVTGIFPSVNQIEVHIRNQQYNLIRDMAELGVFVQSWSPLWTGELSGIESERLAKIAKKYGKTSYQTILGWHLFRGLGAIPKTSQLHRLSENIDVFNFHFPPEEIIFLASLNKDKKIMDYPGDYK